MTGRTRRPDPSRQQRRDRMDAERVTDPYRARGKWPEPTTCPDCHAIFHAGHWQWGTPVMAAEQHRCPACARIRDRVPAAQLTLSGVFYRTHRDEIMHLVHNTETRARAEHPLERIIDIKDADDATVVTFTDSHLAHSIGTALHHAYRGEFVSRYTDEGDLLRVSWNR